MEVLFFCLLFFVSHDTSFPFFIILGGAIRCSIVVLICISWWLMIWSIPHILISHPSVCLHSKMSFRFLFIESFCYQTVENFHIWVFNPLSCVWFVNIFSSFTGWICILLIVLCLVWIVSSVMETCESTFALLCLRGHIKHIIQLCCLLIVSEPTFPHLHHQDQLYCAAPARYRDHLPNCYCWWGAGTVLLWGHHGHLLYLSQVLMDLEDWGMVSLLCPCCHTSDE